MEFTKKSGGNRSEKNAWVGDNLGARAANAARSSALRDYRFTAMFDKGNIKKIKKDAARGPLGTNLGSFKDVVERAEKTAKLFDAYQSDAKVSRGVFSKSTKVTPAELIQQFDNLIADAQAWLKTFNDDGEREKLGKVSDTTVAPDKHRAAKIQACKDLIAGANISKAQLQSQHLEQTTTGFPEQLHFLEGLKLEIAKGGADARTIDLCRYHDADVLQQIGGIHPAGGGTSEVGLVHAPDGSVAYAFKSIDGEAPSMGTPKGAGAIREVLTSKLCEQIKNGPSQLDFGWPATSLTKLKCPDGQVKPGVLIDGINGKKIYDADALSSVKDPAEMEKKKKQSVELFRNLPPAEIQKVLLCNLTFAQFDIKWDNALVEDTPDGLKTRPYDGGAALPPEDSFMDVALFRPGTKGLNMLQDIDGNVHPAANLPMDPLLKKMFLSIDEHGLVDTMNRALAEAGSAGLDAKALGAIDGCKLTLQSIKGIKAIFQADDGTMTLTDFLDACEAKIFSPLAQNKKDDWLAAKKQEYIQLQAQHPTLLIDADSIVPLDNLWLNFMKPDQLQCFHHILKLGGDAILAQYGVAHPIKFSIKTAFNTLQHKMPNSETAKYPDIFKQ